MNATPSEPALVLPRLARREFLGRAAAASGALLVSGSAAVRAQVSAAAEAPSARLNVALIGCGMMGMGHLGRCLGDRTVQVVAVCDVDQVRRDAARQRTEAAYAAERPSGVFHGCIAYNDYRELLVRPDLDAVLIASPDHWHTLLAVDAAKAGKDVYCEKPVSLSVREGRRLVDVVCSYARILQTGTQYRSMPTTRRICTFIREGGLGHIKHVFALWSRADGSAVPYNPVLPAEPVPEGLDWDLWVGPAPWHPYNRRYHKNPALEVVPWAFCEDFGAASVTWHFSHSADVIQYALGVEESGPLEIIHPASGEFPTLTFRYASGTLLHLVEHWGMVRDLYGAVPSTARLAGNFGGVFVGERGWVTTLFGGGPVEGSPADIFVEMGLRSREVSGANNHHANWFECIRTRARPSTDAEIGHRSASLGHLAITALKLQRSLRWDPVREHFPADAAAERLCSRALREPWRL
jgi:hypothetical protein